MSYRHLEDVAEVEDLLASASPVWVFKHSNACGTSHYAKEMVDAYLAAHPADTVAMVVVQTHRPVSNRIAEVLDVTHRSPQLFLVQDGKVLWHASHLSITREAMETARQQAA